jgi:DAK2 domain fusion protein YloV
LKEPTLCGGYMKQQNGYVCDGATLLAGLQAATRWLEQHVGEVNALNVFPVPDGDTGTNMHLTLSAAVSGIQAQPSASGVADQIYRKALMGARGNSGVILSQIIRGFAEGISGHDMLDGAVLAAGLHQAGERAYKAVMKPTEGTILTVARAAGSQAVAAAEQGKDFKDVLEAAVQAADAAVEETLNQLKQLRDAGVVDAGGKGFAVVLHGWLKYVCGEEIERGNNTAPVEVAFDIEDVHSEDDFGYCTTFLLEGEKIPFEDVRATISQMGTSVVVVGDESLVKAHVHTLRPGDVLNYAIDFGDLLQIEIANMDKQTAAIESTGMVSATASRAPKESAADIGTSKRASEEHAPIGVVAVTPGKGFVKIFQSLNAGEVVTGGQTMNPSTQDLVEAIQQLPQREVIVLPNNSNILMAARQAQEFVNGEKDVRVIPSKTVPQGMVAMLALNYTANLDNNEAAMTRALANVCTLEITTAVRDAIVDDTQVTAGQTIGLLNGALVEAGNDRDAVIDALFNRVDMDEYEVVTIYYGEKVDEIQAQALRQRIMERYDHLADVEVQHGGQPFYDFVISVE